MKIIKPLSIGLLAGALSFMPMKKADAGAYINEPFCNLADSSECDFQSSGSFINDGSGHLIEYMGGMDPALNDGRIFTIYGLFNGDENNTTIPSGWNQTVTTNSDGSENYTFAVTGSGNPINFWNDQSYGIDWDGSAPANINDMALDSYLMADVNNGYGDTFRGWIPAPDAITSNLEEFQNPAIVPEPVSSALFLTGGALLGYRGLRKKARNRGRR